MAFVKPMIPVLLNQSKWVPVEAVIMATMFGMNILPRADTGRMNEMVSQPNIYGSLSRDKENIR